MEQVNFDQGKGTVLHTWQFYEFDPSKHDSRNRLIIVLLLIAMLVFSFFTRNPLFPLLIGVWILMFIFLKRNNRLIDFSITTRGVVIDEVFHPYDELENFYLVYKPPQVKKIIFETKQLFNPRIPVQLKNQNPVVIRETLKQYMSEDLDREEEPLSEQLSRWLKF